jgi:SOS-response transcriptional repressor LexA
MTEAADKRFGLLAIRRREELGFSTREAFVRASGLSQSTVQAVENGRGFLHRNRSVKILYAEALRLPLSVLEEAAEGRRDAFPPLLPGSGPPRSVGGRHPRLRAVPVLGLSSAGLGLEAFERGPEMQQFAYVPPSIVEGDPDAFAVQVEGDSMKPYLSPGDWCVCTGRQLDVKGALYFLQGNGGLDDSNRLKLVFPVAGDEGLLELRSTNVRFPPVRVRKEDVGRAALVLYVIRPAENLGIY